MAKLLVSPALLVDALFGEMQPYPEIRVIDATFDRSGGVVELTIEGPKVPDFDRVVAIVHTKRRSVEFRPA